MMKVKILSFLVVFLLASMAFSVSVLNVSANNGDDLEPYNGESILKKEPIEK